MGSGLLGCLVFSFGGGGGWGAMGGGLKQREGQGSVCTTAENLWPGISSTKLLSPVEFLKAGSPRVLLLPLSLALFILKVRYAAAQ